MTLTTHLHLPPPNQNIPSTRADIAIPIYQGTDQGYLLDLQRPPDSATSHQTHDVFLLTSATLTWHDLRHSAKPVLSLPHYRHQNDISLSMSLLHIDRTTINALLYSRLNSLITSFRFDPNPAENFPVTLGRPTTVPALVARDAAVPVQLGLALHRSPLKQRRGRDTDERGEELLADENLRFFTAFSTGPQLELTQRVYSNKDLSITLHAPDRNREVKSAYIIPPTAEPDSDSSDNEDATSAPRAEEHRVNFRALYKYAFPRTTDPTLRTASDDDPEHSVAATTARLKAALTTRLARGDLGIITLLNLHRPAMLYDDLAALQTSIHTLLTTEPTLTPYQLRCLLPAAADDDFPATTTDTDPPSINIEQTYTQILTSWVTPLPEHTPPRVRLRRERLSRALATDLFLSSVGVNLQPQPQTAPPEPEHLLGIRTYANVSARVALPEGMAGVLGRWVVGEDPDEVEYVPDEEDGAARERRRRRKRLQRKGREGGDDVGRLRGEVESWSLGAGAGSQPPAVVVAATQGGSSQVVSSQVGVMSQVERGRHGGRQPVGRKKRRTGF